jgi:cytochrome b561
MFSRIQIIFWIDAALLVLFCALETVPFTGLSLHEWLATGLIGLIVCHILLSWTWIAANSKRLARPNGGRTRANYFVNLCLFVTVVIVIFSGLLVSEVTLPALGFQSVAGDPYWRGIHDRYSNFVFVFAGLHLAINWEWSVAAARKCLGIRTRFE